MLIDSHAHIQGKEYVGEAAAVIARAREAGVATIIAVGGAGDMSSNTEAVVLADSFANVFATVGMHPHDAKDVDVPAKNLRWRWGINAGWKLILPDAVNEPKESVQLFNLAADPLEQQDLAASDPTRVATLRALIDGWWPGK